MLRTSFWSTAACSLLLWQVLAGSTHAADPRAVAKQIDDAIFKVLQEKKVAPSPLADDGEFLRRAYLDITGQIPTYEQTVAFLDSKEPDKRAKLIDELLTRPEYGQHFATLWRDRIISRSDDDKGTRSGYSFEYVDWLADGLNKGRGWDQLVAEMITATGQAKKTPSTLLILSNRMGAFPKPEDLTGMAGRLFMGIQLRCAQCHDHPYVKTWKQDDFWGVAAFFGQLRDNGMANDGNARDPMFTEKPLTDEKKEKNYNNRLKKVALLPEMGPRIGIPTLEDPTKAKRVVNAKLFLAEEPKLEYGKPFRPALAQWLTSAKNPFFARSAANRMWQHLFARGLVEPVEDMRPDVPGLHPALLTLLENEMKGAKFDQRHLIRCICNSETYQRTSKPHAGNQGDAELFSHQKLKLMTPDQMVDSLSIAVGRTVSKGKNRDRQTEPYASKPADGDPTEFTHGIPQFLYQMNASIANTTPQLVNRADPTKPEEAITSLYLAALSRKPKAKEMQRVLAYVKEAKDPRQGYRDLYWALLNSAEFMLVH